MVPKGSSIRIYLLDVKPVGDAVASRFIRASSPSNAIISASRVFADRFVESVVVYDGSVRTCPQLAELTKTSLY